MESRAAIVASTCACLLRGRERLKKFDSLRGNGASNGKMDRLFCVKRVIGLIFCFNAQLDLEVSLFNFGFRVLY